MKVGRRILSLFTHNQKRQLQPDCRHTSNKVPRSGDMEVEIEEDDVIHWLPLELRMEILGCFSATDLCKLRLVNRAWKHMVDDDRVWRALFIGTFGRYEKCDALSWKQFYATNTGIKWHDALKSEHVQLSNNNRVAADVCPETENFKWTTVLAKPTVKKNSKHYCEVEIVKCCASTVNTIKMAFGVCDQIPRFLYNCPFGYSSGGFSRPEDRNSCNYMADGNFMCNSKGVANKKGKKWETGDRIGVLVDAEEGIVRFYHNGEEQASMKIHFKNELHFGASLINGNVIQISQYPKYPISRLSNPPAINLPPSPTQAS